MSSDPLRPRDADQPHTPDQNSSGGASAGRVVVVIVTAIVMAFLLGLLALAASKQTDAVRAAPDTTNSGRR